MAKEKDLTSGENPREKSRSKTSRRNKKEDDEHKEERHRSSRRNKRERSESVESYSSSEEDNDRREEHRRRFKERKKRSKKSHRRSDKDKKKRSSSRKKRSSKQRRKKRSDDSSSSDSSSSSSSGGSSSEDEKGEKKTTVVVNERLLAKLSARGETLEERKARRAQKRAAQITSKFGYTADENPFNDPNLHETFAWKKRDAKRGSEDTKTAAAGVTKTKTLQEIEKVRQRRKDREEQFEEMERIRAEESRMKELENYDDWARKEEEFHLQQQRQRSAIRLIEGREKPIDVFAKNMLLFGSSDKEKNRRASVKYQERYNALDAVESLEAEIEEPPVLLRQLKLEELEELIGDIDAFIRLEREAAAFGGPDVSPEEKAGNETVLKYWENLRVVAADEIKHLKSGGDKGRHASTVKEVSSIFSGQSVADMIKMKGEIESKLQKHASDSSLYREGGEDFDRDYWKFVLEQLAVHVAKAELSDLHSKMLVRQLERLEKRKEELSAQPAQASENGETAEDEKMEARNPALPVNVASDFGDLEEELGLTGEVDLQSKKYNWQDKYRPRKPRYFNRVKTGYDWNKYNQTHYDRDNPPPKTVQGYKFNIFYPDLIDHTKTPQYTLERADTDDFCIIRFHAGPPYEDIAFKIVNREWNRSRKRGFKSTFERGVLSLYFNFTTHWYRK